MGYRSLVGIIFKRRDPSAPSVPEVLALAKTKGILTHEKLGEFWDDEDYGWDNDKFLFYVENVKWYEDYPEVSMMEQLLGFVESLNTDEEGETRYWYDGMFCRVGEENDDNEIKSFGDDPWSLMWLNRSIGFEHSELLGNQQETKSDTPQNKLTDVNKSEEPEHA